MVVVVSGGKSSKTGKESTVALEATESAIASEGRLSSVVGEAATDVDGDEAAVAAKSAAGEDMAWRVRSEPEKGKSEMKDDICSRPRPHLIHFTSLRSDLNRDMTHPQFTL